MDRKITRIDKKARSHAMSTFNLIQITDCHLGSEPHATLLGMDTDQTLIDVLETIRGNEEPDMILVTGDISDDGGPVSYARFLHFIDQYFPSVPLAWLPGNHDDPQNMLVAGQHPIELSHHIHGWNLIFLDSRIPGEEGGRIGAVELQRLERELAAHPNIPTAVFLHHQPVPVGCEWVDQYVVADADAFFEVLDKFDNVKLVSWGHVHQDFRTVRRGVELIATPSTCVQFLPNSDEFRLDTTMPGYRAYKLEEGGAFSASVGRADEKAYPVDMLATGY